MKVEVKNQLESKKLISLCLALVMVMLFVPMAMAEGDDVILEKGNVPVSFTPNSEITFNADGTFEVTYVVESVSTSKNVGVEIGGNLADQDHAAFDAQSAEVIRTVESLPVYTYEEYYNAGEGAVAQYDGEGQLIRVRGDYEYYSTLDQYIVNGPLPDGRYVGTYGEFSQFTSSNNSLRASAAATKTITGKMTTYGDYWPAIPTSDTASNTDPVPNRGTDAQTSAYYGDRIGTSNNKLKVGDVATRPSDNIPYGTELTVTVRAVDTGSTDITKKMYKKDIMGATTPILDIWRWDSPDWFSGVAQHPNDLYFNKKYNVNLSFSSTSNFFTYAI